MAITFSTDPPLLFASRSKRENTMLRGLSRSAPQRLGPALGRACLVLRGIRTAAGEEVLHACHAHLKFCSQSI